MQCEAAPGALFFVACASLPGRTLVSFLASRLRHRVLLPRSREALFVARCGVLFILCGEREVGGGGGILFCTAPVVYRESHAGTHAYERLR